MSTAKVATDRFVYTILVVVALMLLLANASQLGSGSLVVWVVTCSAAIVLIVSAYMLVRRTKRPHR